MLRLLILSLLVIFTLSFPKTTLAHGGVPFILINSIPTVQNQIYGGANNFKIANELAPQNHVVGESINFEIDKKFVPLSPDQVNNTEYIWEFGDGSREVGLSVKHTYTKPKSYFLILKIKNLEYEINEVEFESLQINVLPKKDYTLPQAIIKVGGNVVQEPLKNPLSVKAGETIELDASSSKGKIKSFKWDFGDDSKVETKSKVKHTFKFQEPYIYSIFPILRIEDENGLISDAIIQVSNQGGATTSAQAEKKNNGNLLGYSLIGGAILIFSVAGFLILKSRAKPSKSG